MVVYFVEWYQVKKDRKQKYKALMKKIHRSLRKHKRDLPELLSYKTYEAGRAGSYTNFVEMFEFANQKSMNRFFGRFSKASWLRTLQHEFHKLVPKCSGLTWKEFLKDEWPGE